MEGKEKKDDDDDNDEHDYSYYGTQLHLHSHRNAPTTVNNDKHQDHRKDQNHISKQYEDKEDQVHAQINSCASLMVDKGANPDKAANLSTPSSHHCDSVTLFQETKIGMDIMHIIPCTRVLLFNLSLW